MSNEVSRFGLRKALCRTGCFPTLDALRRVNYIRVSPSSHERMSQHEAFGGSRCAIQTSFTKVQTYA